MTDIARRFAELRSAVASGTYTGPITKVQPKMELPSREALDDMCELIGGPGAQFDALPIPDKMRVIELVNQCDLIEGVAGLKSAIEAIEVDTTTIAEWFKNSKVYYP